MGFPSDRAVRAILNEGRGSAMEDDLKIGCAKLTNFGAFRSC